MGMAIGIDLGTSTSEIAVLRNGRPEIIINMEGQRITPSVVGCNKWKELIVGQSAKSLPSTDRVEEIKRKMGSEERIMLDAKPYLPQEISAMILKHLKEYAEEYLGEEVSEVVITVPAAFDNLQRQATKDAGEIAGLKVERIINEPTAAALAYGLDNIGIDEKVLVYDLGGGTFDVSILEVYEGILDVQVSRGNDRLGGKDFDEKLMDYIINEFYKENEINLRTACNDLRRIKEAAEAAKIALSSAEHTEINLANITIDHNNEPVYLNIEISRREFEILIADMIKSTEDLLDEALKAAKLSVDDINTVLAIGGSTRIPAVRRLLKRKFDNKVKTNINPDEAVALGAAIQAGIKTGHFDQESEILITDTCSHSLGVSVVADVAGYLHPDIFSPIIAIDSTIPITKKDLFYTVHDNQSLVTIEVYEGEDTLVINNRKIGEFQLDGIPEGMAGEQAIEISFSYDINSILEVEAIVLSTGNTLSQVFNLKSMGSEDIEKAKTQLDMVWKSGGLELDRTNIMETDWVNSPLAGKVRIIIDSAERKLKDVDDENQEKIKQLLIHLKEAVYNQDEALTDKYDEELTNLLFDL